MQNSASSDDKIYFLIDQPESAGQTNANTLLARDVYRNIANFIDEALGVARQARQSPDPMHHRYHNTVLIDGDRGTGKSTVLVNLACYLKAFNEETLSQVHICAPVDPTLLEDHDDLFLNVILAAVLSDRKVEEAQQRNPSGRQALAKQLQKLGAALEHMQNQREHTQKGMDKLRAFVGNQQLIQEVHDFFAEVLKLLDKKLLILTIDDVDTGLDKAFENLEVVRRYLTSPYVMPIISGDLPLYHEVIWRKFHGKLTKDSKEGADFSLKCATDLACEYERKVLPVQYRQRMPAVRDYFNSNKVWLCYRSHDGVVELIELANFHGALDSFLNGVINGVGGCRHELVIPTTRALVQFIRVMRKQVFEMKGHEWPAIALGSLGGNAHNIDCVRATYSWLGRLGRESIRDFASGLVEHFCHEPSASVELMVFLCIKKWYSDFYSEEISLLDSPLFNPEKHSDSMFDLFRERIELSWVVNLTGKTANSRLNLLPSFALLHYPPPEVGLVLTRSSKCIFSEGGKAVEMANLANSMMLAIDSGADGKFKYQLYIGRVFELIVMSLVRDVSVPDIISMLGRPPFYSLAAYKRVDGEYYNTIEDDGFYFFGDLTEPAKLLVASINEWRKKRGLDNFFVSPLLVFYAMKKFFSFYENNSIRPMSKNAYDVFFEFDLAAKNVWAAFVFVEKGRVFGVEPSITGARFKGKQDFKEADVYKKDIKPLLSNDKKNKDGFVFGGIASVTRALEDCPVLNMTKDAGIEELLLKQQDAEQVASLPPLSDKKTSKEKESVTEYGVSYKNRLYKIKTPSWKESKHDMVMADILWAIDAFNLMLTNPMFINPEVIGAAMRSLGTLRVSEIIYQYKASFRSKFLLVLLRDSHLAAFGHLPKD